MKMALLKDIPVGHIFFEGHTGEYFVKLRKDGGPSNHCLMFDNNRQTVFTDTHGETIEYIFPDHQEVEPWNEEDQA